MADGRLPSIPPRPAQPAPGPARDVRGARSAFFEAALGKVAPAAPAAQPQAARTAVEPHVTRVKSTEVPSAPEPNSRYRPGALLNIKI